MFNPPNQLQSGIGFSSFGFFAGLGIPAAFIALAEVGVHCWKVFTPADAPPAPGWVGAEFIFTVFYF